MNQPRASQAALDAYEAEKAAREASYEADVLKAAQEAKSRPAPLDTSALDARLKEAAQLKYSPNRNVQRNAWDEFFKTNSEKLGA